MINVSLKDGSKKQYKEGISVYDIALDISEGLARVSCACLVNGKVEDLRYIVNKDIELEILTFDQKGGKDAFRHTTSHILAQAVKRLYPEVKLAIGPAIEDGFYYDFDSESSFNDEDISKIEKEMKSIVKEKLSIEKFTLPRNEAIKLMEEKGEIYKVELINDLPLESEISFYKQGDFVDLCSGPHLMNTSAVKAIKLFNSTGAYWKGSEKNKMLFRIYGTSFAKKNELNEYVEMLEEAKKRDHNKIGRELELFTTAEPIGQGLPLLMPKGAKVIQILQRFVEDEEEKRGYLMTKTPFMAKNDLYKISGHWSHYKDGMFIIGDEEKENEDVLALRPMTCPFQFMIYKSKLRSYKDLPLRYSETSPLFRNESSGEMHGLIRVRQFTISEGHLICTPEQLSKEFKDVVDLINFMMESIGLKEDVSYRFSKWDPDKKDKYIDAPEAWEKAQVEMKKILDEIGLDYEEAIGEAAFYGPKLDIQAKNVYGKEDTIITVQIDFALPDRFDMTYVDSDNQKKRPLVIHRTSIGCYERTLALLIEKYAGAFPVWLAPLQVKIIPIADRHLDYGQKVLDELKSIGVRVELDDRKEKVGYKIREAQLEKVPYMLIIGDNEEKEKTVSVRKRIDSENEVMNLDAFSSNILMDINKRKIW